LRFYKDQLDAYLPFIRTLVLDLREFKTLPKFTLRRLTSVELKPNAPQVLKNFKAELELVRGYLGDDYLQIIQQRLGELKSEVNLLRSKIVSYTPPIKCFTDGAGRVVHQAAIWR
jgi:hypothetical protein